MARPKASQLTERELEIMHVFWRKEREQKLKPALTASDVRDLLEQDGRELAYTTVATLLRILVDKGFVKQINDTRPFDYQAVRSFDDVSTRLVDDLVAKVFSGSREALLLRLVDAKKLSPKERALLQRVLQEDEQ
ncbi:MAG: BlaI/MecI/CopY family transcriptional regulator [Planctomycetales bacterium]|nr:BlaI/MecI/CopY family transcriptional regulator [Planctomycetales bacterium]